MHFSCFVLDNSGFVIVHSDWIRKGASGSYVENIHVTAKETGIAEELIDQRIMVFDSCVNIETVERQYFWRV